MKSGCFDLPVKIESIFQKLVISEGDEYVITDYEGPFSIGEYDSIHKLNGWAEELAKIPKEFVKNTGDLIFNLFESREDFIENWEDATFLPEVKNDKDYGMHIVEGNASAIPSFVENYIDYEALGRDERINVMIIYTDDAAFYK